MLNNTVTVGSGKAIHYGSDCGTICGAAHRNGFFTAPKLVKAEVTCKRCLKAMAAKLEADHAEALEMNETYACQACGTDVPVVEQPTHQDGHAEVATGTVTAEWNQIWEAGDGTHFRIVDTKDDQLQLRSMGSMAKAWVTRAWVEQNMTFVPEPGTDQVAPAAPEAPATVPNTVEAWQAYAERLKDSRDAAEATVAQLLRDLGALASRWERTSAVCDAVPEDPWLAVRRVMAQAGR